MSWYLANCESLSKPGRERKNYFQDKGASESY
jgi:hypothetical protein